MEGGLTSQDAVTLSKALKQAGLDYVDVSSGGITADARNPTAPAYNAAIAEEVRLNADIPVRTVGLIVSPQQAEDILAGGRADMVSLARAFLDDPHWGWHAAQALGADVKRPLQYQRAAPKLWPGATVRA
jgi:2,4-dienoyl-CoA reductase-like NADH-dependent reductase (Old Yellow Enzyme family)